MSKIGKIVLGAGLVFSMAFESVQSMAQTKAKAPAPTTAKPAAKATPVKLDPLLVPRDGYEHKLTTFSKPVTVSGKRYSQKLSYFEEYDDVPFLEFYGNDKGKDGVFSEQDIDYLEYKKYSVKSPDGLFMVGGRSADDIFIIRRSDKLDADLAEATTLLKDVSEFTDVIPTLGQHFQNAPQNLVDVIVQPATSVEAASSHNGVEKTAVPDTVSTKIETAEDSLKRKIALTPVSAELESTPAFTMHLSKTSIVGDEHATLTYTNKSAKDPVQKSLELYGIDDGDGVYRENDFGGFEYRGSHPDGSATVIYGTRHGDKYICNKIASFRTNRGQIELDSKASYQGREFNLKDVPEFKNILKP